MTLDELDRALASAREELNELLDANSEFETHQQESREFIESLRADPEKKHTSTIEYLERNFATLQTATKDYGRYIKEARAELERLELLDKQERPRLEREKEARDHLRLSEAQMIEAQDPLKFDIAQPFLNTDAEAWRQEWVKLFNALYYHTGGINFEQNPTMAELQSPISDDFEQKLCDRLGIPLLWEVTEWRGKLQFPDRLRLNWWPHQIPNPPAEPEGVWDRLVPFLVNENINLRTAAQANLIYLGEARGVSDYKQNWRALN